MYKKLAIGSFGPEVVQLQNFLNMLPSFLPKLLADGSFGNKTRTRTVEFQQKSFLEPDGIVGPITWEALLKLIAQIVPPGGNIPPVIPPPIDASLAKRLEVVKIARTEAEQNGSSLLAAKNSGGKDFTNNRTFRLGYQNLLKYFRVSAPDPNKPGTSAFSEDTITYLTTPGTLAPMAHWCGIFALWALKTANLQVGNWKIGSGISSVQGIKQNFQKTGELRGCVGYINNGFEHHFIIEEAFMDEFGVKKVKTIEGNGDPASNFNFKTRMLGEILVYSPYQ